MYAHVPGLRDQQSFEVQVHTDAYITEFKINFEYTGKIIFDTRTGNKTLRISVNNIITDH